VFRPRRGGRSRAFPVGRGDLLVTGGSTQRTWEHAVLKVARAGPRVSIAFRYGLDSSAYRRDGTSPASPARGENVVDGTPPASPGRGQNGKDGDEDEGRMSP
jgi:hypothetical protein